MSIESTILDQVLELSEDKKAFIVSSILDALPSPLYDDDQGFAETVRRSGEMNEDPSSCVLNWNDVKKGLDR